MRNSFVAMVMLMSTAGMASAQQVIVAAQKIVATDQKEAAKVTADDVIARLMFFDRNQDGKVAIEELSERMQPLVARGDRTRDAALDASEIRDLATAPQQLFKQVSNAAAAGRYGFGDSVGQSSRMHIENTIDDLRLSAELSTQAKRIGQTFADRMEAAARAHVKEAMAPLLMPDAFVQFEADLAQLATSRMILMSSNEGSTTRTFMIVGSDPAMLLRRYTFGPDYLKAATAVMETFKAEQQLNDARRSALVAELSDILNQEDCDDLSAALARRPLVKGAGGLAFGKLTAAQTELQLGMVNQGIVFGVAPAGPSVR